MAEKPRLYLRVTAIKMLDCFTTTLGENHSLMICCLQSQCRLMATLNLREFDPKKQHYPFGGLELRASEQKKTYLIQSDDYDDALSQQREGSLSLWYFFCRNGHEKRKIVVTLLLKRRKNLFLIQISRWPKEQIFTFYLTSKAWIRFLSLSHVQNWKNCRAIFTIFFQWLVKLLVIRPRG